MNSLSRRGFTIIEVMLYLGITGLIMSFMLIGIGSQLNQRRYQDSTSSLFGYIQGEYSLVANVNNSRDETKTCNGSGIKDDVPSTRGTSDCTVVGRVLHSNDAGAGLSASWVIATADVATLSTEGTDVDVLKDAKLIAAADTDQYNMQWSTRLVRPIDGSNAKLTVLIVRMPTTGVIHTYVNDSDASIQPAELLNESISSISKDTKLCVAPDGLLGGVTEPAGVIIRKDASNTSSIDMVSQGSC